MHNAVVDDFGTVTAQVADRQQCAIQHDGSNVEQTPEVFDVGRSLTHFEGITPYMKKQRPVLPNTVPTHHWQNRQGQGIHF